MRNIFGCCTDSVYTVTNIRFEIDGKDASQRLMKINLNELKQYLDEDYQAAANDEFLLLSYVRTMLFYNKIEIKYDYERKFGSEADAIIKRHEAVKEQMWHADIAEISKDLHTDFEHCYEVRWPAEWFCVIPSDYSCYLDSTVAKQLTEQLIFEYLLETLPIIVK